MTSCLVQRPRPLIGLLCTRGRLSRDVWMYILILSMCIFLRTWYDKAEPLAAGARTHGRSLGACTASCRRSERAICVSRVQCAERPHEPQVARDARQVVSAVPSRSRRTRPRR